jgi:molybdopterin-containing oxidoreductase family membrane subunit
VASSTWPKLIGTSKVTDRALIERRHDRCGTAQFGAWLAPWVALLGLGLYAMYLCLRFGLNQTNMDNRFAFGLWIFLDLAIIALGAGAFFTGFLLYILKLKELKAVINSAVVLGFLCYSGAVLVLAIDVGQPLRAWFTFWHPNVHSMLTEVTFCITCYLVVLAFEYLPVILKNRKLKQIPSFLVFEFQMHKLVPVLAGVGTFLSFFHQGSLGGLYGVLRGRPFAYRDGFAIWPSTFFLFVLSAMAAGPAFILLTTWLVEKITGKRLVKDQVKDKLGRVSGILLVAYVMLKSTDTLVWLNSTSRQMGFLPWEYYAWEPFGFSVLLAEIVLCGFLPAMLLISKRTRGHQEILLGAAFLTCMGVVLNRFVLTIQTLALPTLPFDEFLTYVPSWQEIATFLAIVAYAVIVYSLSYRYLSLFPQEKELARSSEGGARVSRN